MLLEYYLDATWMQVGFISNGVVIWLELFNIHLQGFATRVATETLLLRPLNAAIWI